MRHPPDKELDWNPGVALGRLPKTALRVCMQLANSWYCPKVVGYLANKIELVSEA